MKKLVLLFITLLMLMGASVVRAADAMYAVLNGSTLTFYYDSNKSSRSGTKYNLNSAGSAPSWAQKTNITTVVFDSSFKNARPTATTGWFWNLTGLTAITGISNLNTSSVTNMMMMFYGCPLSSIDVSGFNTSNVTTMNSMFYGCSNLKTVNVSGFNTSKVTDMKSMFYNCTSLTSVNVSSFNTSKVTDLSFMFSFCYALTSLDISKFTLTSSQNTKQLLQNAGLKTLTIPATANVLDATACNGVGTTSAPCSLVYPSGFTPQKDKTGSGWYQWKSGYFKDGTAPTPTTTEAYAVLNSSTLTFYYDANKASRSGTKYSLNTGTNAPGWNSSATSVTKVVFNSSFANAKPTSCYQWFYNMSNLTTITGIEYLKTGSVTNMRSMFQGCTKLSSLDLGTFDTQNVTTMYRMFYNCTGLKDLILYEAAFSLGEYDEYSSKFVTKKATTLQEMFYGCKSLKELVLADFTVTSSTNTTSMLKGCSGLEMLYFDKDMEALDTYACEGVGTPSKPCSLENPGFIPHGGYLAYNGEPYLSWKQGCFVDGSNSLYTRLQDDVLTFYYGIRYLTGDDFSLNEGATAPEWSGYASQVKTVVFSDDFKYAAPTTAYAWFRDMNNLTSIKGLENLNTNHLKNLSYMFSGCSKLTSLDLSDFEFTYIVEETVNTMEVADSETKYLLRGCSGLQSLKLKFYANNLDNTACSGVGTASKPCLLDFTGTIEGAVSHGSYFIWKSGYFYNGSEDEIEEYAVLNGSTLTFYFDDKKSSRSGTKYSLNTGANAPGWNGSAASVTKVVFDSSFEDAEPESCYRWFYNMSKLTSITGIGYLHTGFVDNMESMFNGCSSLTSIDVGDFDVSSVTTFAYMFNNCSKITGLDTEEWENSVATDMSYMFAGCTSLYGVSFASDAGSVGGMPDYNTNLSTANVTKMDGMFSGCSGMKTLNLVGFNLSKKPSTTNFLKGCSSLEWMHIPENMGNLNASACAGVGTASNPCYLEYEGGSLDGVTKRTPTYFVWKGGYFRDFRFPGVSYDESTNTLSFWFSDYSGPPMSEIHDYDLNEGSTAPDWLEFASQVKKVEFDESFKDVCPTSCYQWFYNMTNLTAIEGLENLNTEYVTNMASMFNGCKKLTSADISKFTLTSSTNSKLMFNGCSGLKTLTIPATAGYLASDACKGVGTASAPITLNYPSSFTPEKTSTGSGYFVWKSGYFKDTTTPTPTSGEMYAVLSGSTLTFYYDYNKSSRSGTKYNMNSAGTAPSWAQNANIKTVVFDSSFKNARPTATTGWFWNLTGLTAITGISNLNTSSVTNMMMMFYGCPLSSIDVSGFNTSNVTTMNSMFYGCSNLKTVNVSGFNTSKVTDMKSMFYNCTSLTSVNVTSFNTSKVTDLSFMFSFCYALTSLNISNFTLTSSQNTKQLLQNAGLKTLTIPATANVLDATACNGVGTTSAPCSLVFPSGFTPQKDKTYSSYYIWKSGYFKDGKAVVRGDANNDGKVDITDAICIADYVLGKPIAKFSFANADVNKDNQVRLADALIIVDIVLGRSSAPANYRFSKEDAMYLSGQGSDLELYLKGTGSFKGAEMTLTLPDGCTLREASLNPALIDGHELLVNDLGGGCYRLVVMGFNGTPFSQNAAALIRLSLDGHPGEAVRVSDILMASEDLETVAIAGVQGIATGIDNPVAEGLSTENGEWYNLQGQRIASPHHGIYIRNGKKYMVK